MFTVSLLMISIISGCSNYSNPGDTSDKEVLKPSETDCPFGNVHCEYPGNCGRYTDSDDNGICDYSE